MSAILFLPVTDVADGDEPASHGWNSAPARSREVMSYVSRLKVLAASCLALDNTSFATREGVQSASTTRIHGGRHHVGQLVGSTS
jgi:hypothetical protein